MPNIRHPQLLWLILVQQHYHLFESPGEQNWNMNWPPEGDSSEEFGFVGRQTLFWILANNFNFGLSEIVAGAFLKFPIFRQKNEFSYFRPSFPLCRSYVGRMGCIFHENSIYGSYGPHTYGAIPYMGHTGSIIPEKVLIYEPSANPILEKVLIWSLLSLIWSLLDLIWALLSLIWALLSSIWALLSSIWALLSSIWSLLGLIWPYWALFDLDS